MKRKSTIAAFLALLVLVLPLVLAACNLPLIGGQPGPAGSESRINTAAAQTIAARNSAPAGNTTPAPAQPTAPPAGQTTPVPPAPATATSDPSVPCNRAEFVRDVTMPDGSTITPNSVFSKVWELKNTGSCPWTSSYAIVFAGSGTAMSAPAANPFPANVEIKPGESVHVSVMMRAPNDPGDYKGYWMLRSGDQKTFGLGPNATVPFYVEIKVAETYAFAEHVCSAQWSNAGGPLPCPGKDGDPAGYVLAQQNLQMEDSQAREGRGMITAAQLTANGVIIGRFPAVIVPPESDFRATISCAPNSSGCYLQFKVTYKVDDGEEKVLGEWNEGFEAGVTEAVRDLDMVAGKSTAFTFYVTTLAAPEQNRGLWFEPRITR